MAQVETAHGLLMMALQDLYDGECAMAARLGEVRSNMADHELRALVEQDLDRSAEQRDALAAILRTQGQEPDEAQNIWLRSILDDAHNDAETIAHGPLRDIALVGALRKGKQSQRVSYETAVALATRLGANTAQTALERMVDAAQATDAALAEALTRLSRHV